MDTPHAIFSVMPFHREYEYVRLAMKHMTRKFIRLSCLFQALQQRIQNQFPDEQFTTTSEFIDYSSDREDTAVKLNIPHEEVHPHYKVVSNRPTPKVCLLISLVPSPPHCTQAPTH